MTEQAKFICNLETRPDPKDHPWAGARFYNSADRTIVPGDGLAAFRCEFDLPKGTERVELCATALGVFDMYVNGKRVGGEEMKPGWTDYACRVFEFNYDITELCEEKSALIATVSRGWWSGRISFGTYGWHEPAFAAEIRCLDGDGKVLA